MKKTQFKDAFLNIRNQKKSWLSIVAIAILATSIFLGLHYASISLTDMGNNYYDASRFRDAEMVSTMLFTEEDLTAIAETEGVSEVEGYYKTSGKATYDSWNIDVNVVSITDKLNTPIVIEGQLPQNADECAVEEYLAKEKFELEVGDTITIENTGSDAAGSLKSNTYTVTALVQDAENICSMQSLSGTRSIFVPKEAFDTESLEGCVPWVLVRFTNTEGLDRFSSAYAAASEEVLQKLRALGDERSVIRYNDVRDSAQKEIDEKQQEADDAKKELEDARKTLDDGWKELEEGEAKAAETKQTLDEGKAKLDEASVTLANAKTTLDNSSAELASLNTQLQAGKAELDQAKAGLDTWKAELDKQRAEIDKLPAEQKAIALAAWKANKKEYNQKLAEYKAGLEQYNARYAQYQNAVSALNSKYAEYESGLQQYYAGQAAYADGLAQYEAGLKKLKKARKELKDGEKEYKDGLKEYKEALPELEDAKEKLSNLNPCHWITLGAEENASYVNLKTNIKNVRDIGLSFALVFLIVAVLVIYSTVGRTVEDQRKIVGTSKALGLLNSETLKKYLAFGQSATVLGILLGIVFGYFIIQKIILRAYGSFYVPNAFSAFDLKITAILFIFFLILATAAVTIACLVLLRTNAVTLLQDKIPPVKRKAKTKKSRLPLKTKLMIQNVWSDKKRIVITIISVMGCCLLITAGLSIRWSIQQTIHTQFSRIFQYDLKIVYDSEKADTAVPQVSKMLSDAGTEFTQVSMSTRLLDVNGKLYSGSLICGNMAEINNYFHRLDVKTGKEITEDGTGIWLNEKTAELSGIRAGDEILVYDSSMNPTSVPVAGIFKEYLGNELFMSAESYRNAFGEEPADNTFLVKLNGASYNNTATSEEAAAASPEERSLPTLYSAELNDIPGVTAVGSLQSQQRSYTRFVSVMDYIALVMTIMAIVMAFFILLNLVSMYMNQKKRELTVMRINGFLVSEVRSYILREAYFTTVLGILLGLVFGTLLSWNTLKLAEGAGIQLIRQIQPGACLLSAAITLVFTVIIYLIALRKLKDLKLTDIE